MINSEYSTFRIEQNKKIFKDVLDVIAYNTTAKYITWKKFYDEKLKLYYYYSEDKEYNESYYMYEEGINDELVFQLISDKDKVNYEYDTVVFKKELNDLLKDIKASLEPTKKTYGTYDSIYDYEDDYYGCYKSYKIEKAEKQLSTVEPMSNREIL